MSEKQVKIAKALTVNVSADELWEIVGPGFAEAGKWSTAVDHSVGQGVGQFEGAVCDTRSCDLSAKGFSSVNEKITEYDPANQAMAFDVIEGLPSFVTYTNNRTVITSINENSCKAELQITVRMKPLLGALLGGMFKRNLSNLIDSALDDLKVYAETGEPSERKKARISKLAA